MAITKSKWNELVIYRRLYKKDTVSQRSPQPKAHRMCRDPIGVVGRSSSLDVPPIEDLF